MLPYSLTLAGYSSITVPYWELLVVLYLVKYPQGGNTMFPGWECFVPKVGISCEPPAPDASM